MSLNGAMNSGISGLSANSQAMGIIADNITNLNTIGYKATEARFSTLVTGAGNTGSTYSPGGLSASPYQAAERQGAVLASDSTTDIAMSGKGFFVVNTDPDPTTGTYLYTRAGQFSVNELGLLVNTGGYYLQGWPTLPDGSYDVDQNGIADASVPDPTSLSNLHPIQVASLAGTVTPTSTVDLALNLPATALVGATNTATVLVYDALGVGHNVALLWTKTVAAPATWSLEVTGMTRADSGAASVSGATLASFPLTIDTVVFNGDGTPASFTPVALSIPAGDWTTAALASSISFNLGAVNQANGVTQFASDFSIVSINQNGVTFGRFQSIGMTEDGEVTASFDNGVQRTIFRLPVATFANPSALEGKSGNAWSPTVNAGTLFLNPAGTGAAGKIAPSSLETSTVDLGKEFTNMIITQRAYSASSRIITTADQMLEELVRIKR
ncbi:MAG: flagellar hook protein FlgE [Alphaproteobacteria bacterium]|nr:flagellar hook protein FlgE [Alphaproteobacteria bacterium]